MASRARHWPRRRRNGRGLRKASAEAHVVHSKGRTACSASRELRVRISTLSETRFLNPGAVGRRRPDQSIEDSQTGYVCRAGVELLRARMIPSSNSICTNSETDPGFARIGCYFAALRTHEEKARATSRLKVTRDALLELPFILVKQDNLRFFSRRQGIIVSISGREEKLRCFPVS